MNFTGVRTKRWEALNLLWGETSKQTEQQVHDSVSERAVDNLNGQVRRQIVWEIENRIWNSVICGKYKFSTLRRSNEL